MPRPSPRPQSPSRAFRALGVSLVGVLAGSLCTMPALGNEGLVEAQPSTPTSLHSVQLPIAPVPGEIDLGARAGWVWMEGPTHRIVLERHVDVVLGGHRFRAERANIWLSPIGDAPGRYQIYAIFEDLVAPDGSMSISAKEIPVRGVIDTSDPISLKMDARFDQPPKGKSETGEFVLRTNELFAQRVLGLAAPDTDPVSNPAYVFESNQSPAKGSAQGTRVSSGDGVKQIPDPVFRPSGIFSLSIGDRVVAQGSQSDHPGTISASGGVVVQYQDPQTRQSLDLKGERMVVFLKPGKLTDTLGRIRAEDIEGIYLEGGVLAGNEDWTARAPKMYLDVARGRALMIDAVFWTVDEKTGMPLYVRADAVRQESRNEFTASKAQIANTAFFEPDFTIGIKDIQVTIDDPSPNGNPDARRVQIDGKGVTLNAGGVPFMWLPGFKGDLDAFPLRQIKLGDSNRAGFAFKTRWNLFSLLKADTPPGIKADLNLDYYAERGIAIGIDGQWDRNGHTGSLFSYLVAEDNGTDITYRGTQIERDGQTRGIISVNDLWQVNDLWTVASRLNHISDEAFIPAFFEQIGRQAEDFDTSVQLERKDNDSYFAIEAGSHLNDFISAEHLLQSPGYVVDKIPEIRYISMTQDPLSENYPGMISYHFEARAGLMRLGFSEVTAAAYGFDTTSLADSAFGTLPSESLGDIFRGLGLDESSVSRLDTRHEVTGQFDVGPVKITPFVVGRLTHYDSTFDSFSPQQSDNTRLWGGGGVTVSTSLQKVDDDAESRLFDIHRLRHIIEPSLSVWFADSNFDIGDTPVFDDEVEDLLHGTMLRAAIDQTWQTKRGGVGRWRDVDLLKIRTEYIASDSTAGMSAIPEFNSTRPELSNPGEYIGASALWQPTEVLGIAGEIIYNLDAKMTARSSIGMIIQHRPEFITSLEYREIQALGDEYLAGTVSYKLNDKYAVQSVATYNFDQNDFQTFNTQILREFQIGTLGVQINFNNIRSETSIGIVFRPVGSSGGLRFNDTGLGN